MCSEYMIKHGITIMVDKDINAIDLERILGRANAKTGVREKLFLERHIIIMIIIK